VTSGVINAAFIAPWQAGMIHSRQHAICEFSMNEIRTIR
jgi:hypothetical protein